MIAIRRRDAKDWPCPWICIDRQSASSHPEKWELKAALDYVKANLSEDNPIAVYDVRGWYQKRILPHPARLIAEGTREGEEAKVKYGKFQFDEEQAFFVDLNGEEMYHTEVVETLNALLVVAQDAMQFHHYLYTIRKGDLNPSFEEWLETVNPRLASLPEHLK